MRTDFSPRIIAHRGNSLQFPENTIESFKSALEYGCDALEIDVWLTRDSKLIVWHDETVDRTTECTGPVSSFTLKELQGMDAAYHFKPDEGFPLRASGIHPVSLEDLLCTFPNALFNIDLKSKDERIINVYYDTLKRANALDRVCTASFHQGIQDALSKRHPDILLSLGPRQVWLGMLLPMTLKEGCIVQGPRKVARRYFIDAVHRKRGRIMIWTINDKDEALSLLDKGVDCLFTDNPGILLGGTI